MFGRFFGVYLGPAVISGSSARAVSTANTGLRLPYPMAVANVGRMVGTPLTDLRTAVLEQLNGIDGSTHLNDVLRSLAEVPVLVRPLSGQCSAYES
jgi:hypothetical protein